MIIEEGNDNTGMIGVDIGLMKDALSIELYLVRKVLFEQLVKVVLYFLSIAGFDSREIQIPPSLTYQQTALHEFQAESVIVQPFLFGLRPLDVAHTLLLHVVLLHRFVHEMLVEIVELLSEADLDLFEGLYLQSCLVKGFD